MPPMPPIALSPPLPPVARAMAEACGTKKKRALLAAGSIDIADAGANDGNGAVQPVALPSIERPGSGASSPHPQPRRAKLRVEAAGAELSERERALRLERRTRQECDTLLLEAWLAAALKEPPSHGGGKGNGASSAHTHLPNTPRGGSQTLAPRAEVGDGGDPHTGSRAPGEALTRQALKQAGLSPAEIERLYRSMYVYSVGFHDVLRDVLARANDPLHVKNLSGSGQTKAPAPTSKRGLLGNVWKGFLRISEDALRVQFKSEFLATVDGAARAEEELTELRQRLHETSRAADGEREAAQRLANEAEEARSMVAHAEAAQKAARDALERERHSHQHAVHKYLRAAEHRNALQGDVVAAVARAEDAEARAEAKATEAADLCAQVTALKVQASAVKSELASYRARATRAEAKVGALESAAASAAERAAQADQRCSEAHKKCRDEMNAKVLLQSDLHCKKEIIRKQVADIEEGVAELARSREAQAAACAELRERTVERDRLLAHEADLESDLAIAHAKLGDAQGALEGTRRDLAALEESVAAEKSARCNAERALASAREDLEGERRALEERGEAVARDVVLAIPQLARALSCERSARLAAKRHLSESRANEAALGVELAMVQRRLDAERATHSEAQSSLESTRNELEAERSTVTDLHAMRARLEASQADLADKLKDSRAREAALEKALAEGGTTIVGLQTSLTGVRQELAESVGALERSQRSHREARDRLCELTDAHARTCDDLAEVTAARDALARDTAVLEEAVAMRDAEVAAGRTALESARAELASRTARIDELVKDKTGLVDELAEARGHLSEMGEERASLDRRRVELEGRVTALESSLREVRTALSAKEAELAEAVALARAEEEILARKADDLSKQVEEKVGELTAEQDARRLVEAQLTDVRDAHGLAVTAKEEAESMLKQAHAVRSFLQGEIGALKSRVEALKARGRDETEKARAQQQRIDLLRSKRDSEMAQALETKEAENDRLTEELRGARAAHKADTDALRHELAMRERELCDERERAAKAFAPVRHSASDAQEEM